VIPKRTFWATVGYSAGVATTVYVRKRVRRALGPTGSDAVIRARGAARSVKVALDEGRAAMRETERRLRQEYDPRGREGPSGGSGAADTLTRQ
jgi:hypothetical protein